MQVRVRVDTIRQLVRVSGVSMAKIAERLGLSDTMISLKLQGHRPLFMDEIGPIVSVINDHGSTKVTDQQVIKLIGKENIKVRGFAN